MKIDEKELNELFKEIKNNNKMAFEKLYSRYNKLVYGIAFSILKNKQDAEDMVQNVFTKIYSIDKNKLPSSNEATWLYSVTKNETINYLKNKKNNIDLDSIYELEDNNNEIDKIINQDKYNRIISKLNEKEREIVSLKILSNLSFEEIGKILNVPTGTIKWRYYKSVHTLKLLLSNLGMFIVSFITTITVFKNNQRSLPNSEIQEDTAVEKPNINENNEIELDKPEENIIMEDINSQTQENIVVETQTINDNNYVGISFLGISIFFFITTIIFLIIFTKNQLKRGKKLSK